jgi:hypothetical protein
MAKRNYCVLPLTFFTMKKYIILFSILFFLSCKQKPTFKKEILGNWKSVSVENMNGTYGFREFSFDDKKWEVKFTLFTDEQMKNPVFTFKGIGSYNYQDQSKNLQNTANYIFGFDKKFMTLKTTDTLVAKNFGLSALVLNQETDVTKDGISFIESKSACDKEFDLVSIKNDTLFLGKRPEQGKNLCQEANRPKSYGLPLIRKKRDDFVS